MKESNGYRERVREAIVTRNGAPIMNGSLNHAGIIVAEAFTAAHRNIALLSHRLDQSCYDESVRDAAAAFLADPDHRARILVESSLWDEGNNFEWEKHPFVKSLKDFLGTDDSARLQVRVVPKDWAVRYSFNFLILDDYGFRFEADRKKPAAVAAFYSESDDGLKDVRHLLGIFEDLWRISKSLKTDH